MKEAKGYQSLSGFFKRCYGQWKLIRNYIGQADVVFIFMATIRAVIAVHLCRKCKKPFAVYSGNDWYEDSCINYKWQSGIRSWGRPLYASVFGLLERYVMHSSRFKIVNGYKLRTRYRNTPGILIQTRPLIQMRSEDCWFREDSCQDMHIRILCVSTLIPRKGIEYLIEGFSLAKNRLADKDLQLWLVGTYGDEEYKNRLDRIAKTCNVALSIKWWGYIPNGPDLFEVFRNADLFVLASINEGFPRVIWEAMGQGLPIIASGIPNIVREFEGDNVVLFVKPGSPIAIAEGICSLVKDNALRRRLIYEGAKKVREVLEETAADQFINHFKANYQGCETRVR